MNKMTLNVTQDTAINANNSLNLSGFLSTIKPNHRRSRRHRMRTGAPDRDPNDNPDNSSDDDDNHNNNNNNNNNIIIIIL